VARPADDVFALGVCAYRLVTGWYLPPMEVRSEEGERWHMEWRAPMSPREMNPRVEAQLEELIVRMLARRPEERPSAVELAEALEQAARSAGPGADLPLFQRGQQEAAVENLAPVQRQERGREGEVTPAGRGTARARGRTWAAYAACVVFGAIISAVALGWGLQPGQQARGVEVAQPAPGQVQREEEQAGLGDTGLKAPAASVKEAPSAVRPGRPVPETPLENQQRAPHCVAGAEVIIHGGCWVEVPSMKPPCKEPFYEWQGRCFMPSLTRPRQPTSEPP
jgi:hypothetical protein